MNEKIKFLNLEKNDKKDYLLKDYLKTLKKTTITEELEWDDWYNFMNTHKNKWFKNMSNFWERPYLVYMYNENSIICYAEDTIYKRNE